MAEDDQTIIIKRINKGGHGHHGGAWKVAYADFVTAMMAFFLLLWLLSSASDEQLTGIADYFAPTVGVAGGQGIGLAGGIAVQEGKQKTDTSAAPAIVFGAPTQGDIIDVQTDEEINEERENLNFKNYETAIQSSISDDSELSESKNQITVDMTPDGLRIQIYDSEARPMFAGNTDQLQDFAMKILTKVAGVVKNVPNFISIDGHTAEYLDDGTIDQWSLTSSRANSARKFLQSVGVKENQIGRIQGKGTREHVDENNPQSVRNSRVSITILKKKVLGYSRNNYADPSVVDGF